MIHIIFGFSMFLIRKHISVERTQQLILLLFLILSLPLLGIERYKYKQDHPVNWFEPNADENLLFIRSNVYSYSPSDITTLRPDLFLPGHFSLGHS